jgi:hypothetical protein
MKIIVKPSDLIGRLVWDMYEYHVLQDLSKKQINELIEKNEEFELSEKDAFVIGLLNTIFTDELIYKYTQYLRQILDIKNFSNLEHDKDGSPTHRSYVTKQMLLTYSDNFFKKIPTDYILVGEPKFNIQLKQLTEIHEIFKNEIEQLEVSIVKKWECVKYGQVKKIINKIQWI